MPSKHRIQQKFLDQLETRQLWFGEIKKTIDNSRNGRMLVHIPEISGTDTSDSALFDCAWSSPFAGATQLGAQTDPNDPSAAQTSYGMWMRPPDPGTVVVVGMIMVNAIHELVILSCLFPANRNSMVPGIPAGVTDDGKSNPVTEPNINADPKSFDPSYEFKGGGKVSVKAETRPRHPLADNIFHQGLANDFTRGMTTSGARREDISEVFGILTPGSRQDGNPRQRNPGHQFVMDDNENSNLIRLRTGQGMQILLNDTADLIYIVNKRGTGYIEIDGDGNIDIFGRGSFNVRTMGDLNLRADQNVNIEAGQDINLKAANNAPHPYDEGRGLGGVVSDPLLALVDPMVGADFQKVLQNGSINIEGFKDVNIKGQNVEIAALPTGQNLIMGLEGQLVLKSAGQLRMESQDIIGDAVGRVSPQGATPGNLLFTATGTLDARALISTIQGTTKLNLEGALVDIATSITPPAIKPVLEISKYIKQTTKPMTLFGFNVDPTPLPLPTQPTKQVQGEKVPPTQLGKDTDGNPLTPPIPFHEGMLTGGVNTILTRVPQPEPSKSKKDQPFKGGFKAK